LAACTAGDAAQRERRESRASVGGRQGPAAAARGAPDFQDVWRPARLCGSVAPPVLDERQADLAADLFAHWGELARPLNPARSADGRFGASVGRPGEGPARWSAEGSTRVGTSRRDGGWVEEEPGRAERRTQALEGLQRAEAGTQQLLPDAQLGKQSDQPASATPINALRLFAAQGCGTYTSPLNLKPGSTAPAAMACLELVGDSLAVYRRFGLRVEWTKEMVGKLVEVKLTAVPLELFEPRLVDRLVGPVELAKERLEKMARSKAFAVGLLFGVEVARALIAHIDRVVALTDSLPLLAEHDMRVLFEKGFAALESDVAQAADALLEEMQAAGTTPTGAASAVKHAQDLLATAGNRFRDLDVLARLNPNCPNGVVQRYLSDLQFANAARTDSAHAAQRAAEAKKLEAAAGKEAGSARGSGSGGGGGGGEAGGAPAHTTPGERRHAAAVLGGVCILHNSNDGCPGKRGCRHAHVLLSAEAVAALPAAVRLVFVPHGGVRTGPAISARDRPALCASCGGRRRGRARAEKRSTRRQRRLVQRPALLRACPAGQCAAAAAQSGWTRRRPRRSRRGPPHHRKRTRGSARSTGPGERLLGRPGGWPRPSRASRRRPVSCGAR
jgi:hypothetical protein